MTDEKRAREWHGHSAACGSARGPNKPPKRFYDGFIVRNYPLIGVTVPPNRAYEGSGSMYLNRDYSSIGWVIPSPGFHLVQTGACVLLPQAARSTTMPSCSSSPLKLHA